MMEDRTNSQFDASEQKKGLASEQPAGQTGITPGAILSEAEELIKKAEEAKAQKKSLLVTDAAGEHKENKEKANKENPFPVDAFPESIQQIIRETNKCLSFPIDFVGASILSAAGIVIGNTKVIQAKRTWYEKPVLYLIIVGSSGINKSHPLSFIFEPLWKLNKKAYKEYKEAKKKYDSIMQLTRKEKRELGFTEDPPKPVWIKPLVSDITPEGLAQAHSYNLRGIGLYSEEAIAWLNNFDRYSKGSEEQFWLSAWSGKPVVIERKTSDPIFISSPAISVVGTTQPGILNQFAGNSRSLSGFIARILFAFPDGLMKDDWKDNEVDELIIENWHKIISRLVKLPTKFDEEDNVKPDILKFDPDAKNLWILWYNRNTDLINGTEDDTRRGIYTKFNQYTLRFALILELLRWACGESDANTIGVEAISGAIKLTEYFRQTALKVHEVTPDTLQQLPTDKQKLYEALPEKFTTAEGLAIAESIKIPERTCKRFFKSGKLFKRLKRGDYLKLL